MTLEEFLRRAWTEMKDRDRRDWEVGSVQSVFYPDDRALNHVEFLLNNCEQGTWISERFQVFMWEPVTVDELKGEVVRLRKELYAARQALEGDRG